MFRFSEIQSLLYHQGSDLANHDWSPWSQKGSFLETDDEILSKDLDVMSKGSVPGDDVLIPGSLAIRVICLRDGKECHTAADATALTKAEVPSLRRAGQHLPYAVWCFSSFSRR
jgi:hypothetical protein